MVTFIKFLNSNPVEVCLLEPEASNSGRAWNSDIAQRTDHIPLVLACTSTPQLPFKIPQIPSNRDHKALNRWTLGGLGIRAIIWSALRRSRHLDPLGLFEPWSELLTRRVHADYI